MARQSLRSWVQEALTDTSKEGFLTMMSCVHCIGTAEKDIHTIKMGGDKQWTADELSEVFDAKARSYGQDLPGTQLFTLKAFYGGRTVPEAEHPFRVEGENLYPGGGTDSPDGKGFMQQMMRHNEAVVGMAFRTVHETNLLLMTLNKQLGQDLIASRTAELDAVGVVKDMVLKDGDLSHERRMKQLEYQRQTEERKKWFSWGPVLVNQLLGREVFPQSTADTALLEGVIEQLKPADVQMLAGKLPPHLMGPLAGRINQYLEKKRAEAATDIKALNGLNPEAEAAGETNDEAAE